MSASNTLTFDQTPTHRAVLDDVGGATKQNDVEFPPDPTTHPTAEEYNQLCLQAVALNRVVPVALIYVTFPGGVPTVSAVSAARTTFTTANVTATDNAAGDTSLTFASGLLPSSLVPPQVSLSEDVEIDRVRVYAIANGWRVKTKLGATGTDCAFTLAVF